MFVNNRRQYTNRFQTSEITASTLQNMDIDSIKTMIVDSLKMLSKSIDEIALSLKEVEEKLDAHDVRLKRTENQVDKYGSKFTAIDSEFMGIRNEFETLKGYSQNISQDLISNNTYSDKPVMLGTGFSNITPEYLRSLQRK